MKKSLLLFCLTTLFFFSSSKAKEAPFKSFFLNGFLENHSSLQDAMSHLTKSDDDRPFLAIENFNPYKNAIAEHDSLEFSSGASCHDPIKSTKIKRFSLGLLAGTSYNTFESFSAEAFHWSPLIGITSSYRLTNTLQVHLDLTQRMAFGKTRDIKHLETNPPLEGSLDYWTYKQSLSRLVIYETPLSISYRPNTSNPFFRAFRFHLGFRPTVLFVLDKTSGGSIKNNGVPPEGWKIPARQAGLKKADLGLLLGFDVFIKKNLYLNFSANLNFRDLTDDAFWNVDPQINKNTDFQVSLRWTPLKF